MTTQDDGMPQAPAWQEVLLVCKACGKRGSGPKHLKSKSIVAEARRLLRATRPRPRVLLTGCLGLCPKGAVAVARIGGEQGGARIVPVKSIKRFERLLPMLAQRPSAPGSMSVRPGPSAARLATEALASQPPSIDDGDDDGDAVPASLVD